MSIISGRRTVCGFVLFLLLPSFAYNPGPVSSTKANKNPDKNTDNKAEGHVNGKRLVGNRQDPLAEFTHHKHGKRSIMKGVQYANRKL